MAVDADLRDVIAATLSALHAIDARLTGLERKSATPRSPEVTAAISALQDSIKTLVTKGAS
jgi:hypothetical protein